MNGSLPRILAASVVALATAAAGCSEVSGRRKIQQGNKFYRDGQYKEAAARFEEAQALVPNLPVLWLNKGYNCRQMIIPGAKTPDSAAASKCAIEAFQRLKELAPGDQRADLLYTQTLFDSDEFEALVKIFEGKYKQNPRDIDAVFGLIQTYSKWNKLDEALEWYEKKAEIQATDPEPQYAVGVYIWQNLLQKGGGQDKATFDPRPNPNKPREVKVLPLGASGDIVSQQRLDLADKGIEYLQKAVAMRPTYHEAMTYVNLLYRQKSFAYFDQPDEWQKCIDQALEWMRKSLTTQGKPIPATLAALKPAGDDEAEPGAAAAAESSNPVAAQGNAKNKTKHKGKRRK